MTKKTFALGAGFVAAGVFASLLVVHLMAGSSDQGGKYEQEPAAAFLFEQRPISSECDQKPGESHMTHAVLVAGNRAPYSFTRPEKVTLTRADVPALTIAADPSSIITASGSSRNDWAVNFCALGEGQTEAEAREHLQQISMNRVGSALSLNGPPLSTGYHARGFLAVDAPADAPLIIHASYSAAQVHNMAGPVRVAASHARATILDTSGPVDANAMVVDFAASRGRVNLSAESINIKITARQFEGTLLASAQRPLRVLVPAGFSTPLEAMVNHPRAFICRADFCSKVKQEKRDGLYIFSYPGEGSSEPLHLRSEQSTVVIDTINGK